MPMILLVANAVCRKQEAAALLFTWLVAAAAVSVYAIVQFQLGAERVHAFFEGPMTLVRTLVLVIAVAAAMVVTSRGTGRLVAWGCLAATVPALLLTFSRAGWLSLWITVTFVGAVRRSRVLLGSSLLGLSAAITLAVAFPQTTAGSLLRSIAEPMNPALERFGESTFQRMWMYRAALAVFLDHPVTGVGQRNFPHVYGRYIPEDLRNDKAIADDGSVYTGFAHAHSLYLHRLATQGLVGLGAFLWLIGTAIRMTQRDHRQARDPFLRAASLGILAAIVAFLALGLFDENARDSESIMQLWFLRGLAAAIDRMVRGTAQGSDLATGPSGYRPWDHM
jgi:O-antigen ligase